jgi:L-threonylcarbamoyladenylate synthase
MRALRSAAVSSRAGGVIAYPTEAVFGLGCSPYDEAAIARVISLKQRARDKGLIVIAAHSAQLDGLVAPGAREAFDGRADNVAADDRATTFVVPAGRDASALLCGGRATIAVRICKHPVARALCLYADGPLVSTSANRSGSRPARTAVQARCWFLRQVDVIVGGRVGKDLRPSRIIDLMTGEVLRG